MQAESNPSTAAGQGCLCLFERPRSRGGGCG